MSKITAGLRAITICMFLCAGTVAFAGGQTETSGTSAAESILKIGTPNEVKIANIFSDYYLGIFAHISNPPLMKMSGDGVLVGQTAESYSTSEDNTRWTFTIRDDLYWSDGRKVTPEDIRFSIEFTGENNPNAGWIGDTLADSDTNGNDVVLTFNKPYTNLDLEFATYNILPKHLWEDVNDPMGTTDPALFVGCGPFVIDRVDLDAGIIEFTRNPHWQGEEPELDGYEIHLYKTTQVLSLALEKGEIDTFYKYASSYPYAGIDQLRKTGKFAFVQKPNLGLVFLGFNLQRSPGNDRSFREAVSYAIDYEEILELDGMGFGSTPNRGFVAPSMGGFVETEPLSYDPDRAAALLEAADYIDSDGDGLIEDTDGADLTLEVVVRSDWSRVGELLVDYLADIGIASDLRSLELSSWVAAKDEYQYDLTVTRTTPWGMLMHAGWGTGYFDARRTGRGVLHILDDPDFLTLADEILATADPEVRDDQAKRIQRYYAEELPAIALYWNTIVTPFAKEYSGWMPDPLYGIYNIDTLVSVERQP